MNDIIIKNLNELKRDKNKGLYKQGLAISKEKHHLIYDYLEKINYSIQDIEKELNKEPDNSVLICILVYVCWIQESVKELQNSYQEYAIKNFSYDMVLLKDNENFLNAIRSFVFAHPLTTNRHELFGFDGTLRCADIHLSETSITSWFWKNEDKYFLDKNGLAPYKNQSVDYWLYIYNDKKYNNQFKQYIGISLKTICDIANDYIDFIYKLDNHLAKIKVQKGVNSQDEKR